MIAGTRTRFLRNEPDAQARDGTATAGGRSTEVEAACGGTGREAAGVRGLWWHPADIDGGW